MNSPIESLTSANSALLLIDHQIGTMRLIANLPLERVVANTVALAHAARILGLPVVLTSSQEDKVQGPLIPELSEILPDAFTARIRRTGLVNAWEDPDFRAATEATGRRHLIIAGVTTDVCLIFPAISAIRDGFRVQAVMDASGSPYETSEELARRRMADAGVVLTATNTLIAELAGDWSRPEGEDLLKVLFEYVLPPMN